MDNETNLDNLFEDALNPDESADDNGQQEEQPGEQNEQQQEQQEQDHAERARQAAARREREAEVQRREARAYQQARAEVSATLQRLGIKNPKTDKVIATVEELEEYEKGLSDERLSSGTGTAEDIKRVVRDAIREVQPAPQPKHPADDQESQRQLAEIRAMDPAMTDIKAILESEAGEKFRGYVNKGLNFVDAYTLAAKDRLARIQANRAGAKAGGKSHLNATRQQGVGALSVPADEMVLFRELNPDATEADIQKYYNADKKKFGR